MLEIVSFTLGPAQTNAYLVADSETKEAAVIDPAWDGHIILAEAQKRGWRIAHLWYTHAHFDHIGGQVLLQTRTIRCRLWRCTQTIMSCGAPAAVAHSSASTS